MTPDTPLLSVVVVSWNRAEELEHCVRSVLECTRYEPVEVIVVDNGSTDSSADAVRSFGPAVRLIENDRNIGAPAARNQGMRAANGEVIALLDCDTYVTDDVIGRAATALLRRPDTAMLGCKLCFPDGRRQHSAYRAMSVRLSLIQNLWLYRLVPAHRRAELLLGGYWDEDREVDVDWLAGACLVFRRELFLESGGFNEELFPEDSEWGIRLSRAGHRIVYAPQLGVVYHTGSGSLADNDKLRRYHWAGVQAYAVLNDEKRANVYRLALLFGAAVRWTAYSIAAAVKSDDYFITQASHHRALVEIYLRPDKSR